MFLYGAETYRCPGSAPRATDTRLSLASLRSRGGAYRQVNCDENTLQLKLRIWTLSLYSLYRLTVNWICFGQQLKLFVSKYIWTCIAGTLSWICTEMFYKIIFQKLEDLSFWPNSNCCHQINYISNIYNVKLTEFYIYLQNIYNLQYI